MLKESDLFDDQKQCINFIGDGEDSLVFADVGSGKTVIGGTSCRNKIEKFGEANRFLITAPKLVCLHTWATEFAEWAHLKDYEPAIAVGTEAQRIKAIESDTPLVVMNYDNLSWLYDRYPVKRFTKDKKRQRVDTLPFDGLLLDEVDKLNNISTSRFKDVRNRVRRFKCRIGMTGTPTPLNLLSLWGITYMVDGGQTFGRAFTDWRREYFYPTDYDQYNWAPFIDTFEKLVAALDGLAFRLEAQGIPPVVMQKPRYFQLPNEARRIYDELEDELYAEFMAPGGDMRILDSVNAGVNHGKLAQICSGFSYTGKGKTKQAVWHTEAKLDAMRTMHRVFSDKQMIVAYHFVEERERIAALMGDTFRYLGVSDKKDAETIRAWNAGELPRLGLHPMSASHGLNLQKSAAHTIAGFTLPYSGGLYKQLTGRLARRGQTAKQIDVWPIVARDTLDEDRLDIIQERVGLGKDFLDALKARR